MGFALGWHDGRDAVRQCGSHLDRVTRQLREQPCVASECFSKRKVAVTEGIQPKVSVGCAKVLRAIEASPVKARYEKNASARPKKISHASTTLSPLYASTTSNKTFCSLSLILSPPTPPPPPNPSLAIMSYRQAFSAFYTRNFERRPWITLAVTNGILGVVADGAAQTLEHISQAQAQQEKAQTQPTTDTAALSHPTSEWDFSRSARFLAFNVGMAPLLAEWNRFLEFRFPLRTASAAGAASTLGKVSMRALANRVAMDQLFL